MTNESRLDPPYGASTCSRLSAIRSQGPKVAALVRLLMPFEQLEGSGLVQMP
jgi:hypothetical protein